MQFQYWSSRWKLRSHAIPVMLEVWLITAALLLVIGFSRHVVAQSVGERHVALLIGAGQLDGALALAEPAADVAALARRLRQRSFELVTLDENGRCATGEPRIDPARDVLEALITCFIEAAAGSRQAFFFFSGQTVRYASGNHLVPARAPSEGSIEGQTVALRSVLDRLEQANPGLTIVAIDGARSAAKALSPSAPGLARVATTSKARIVVFSASAGTWVDEPPANAAGGQPQRGEATHIVKPESLAGATTAANPSLSPLTHRLVGVLDEDLDKRSLGESGTAVGPLFIRTSERDDPASQPGEVVIENVSRQEVLGRLPVIGNSACEILSWRAMAMGRCIETAAAYEACGKSRPMQERLQAQCPDEWGSLLKDVLRGSIAAAMRGNKCEGLTRVVKQYESEPAMAALPEFKETRSLGQYTCGLEAAERAKAEFPRVVKERNCRLTKEFIAHNEQAIEPEMRTQLDQLLKSTCCPEIGLGAECLTRKATLARIATKLAENGCSIGQTAEAKSARAAHMVAQLSAEGSLGIDLSVNGTLIDKVWSRIETLKKGDCACQKGEVLSKAGACVCQGYGASDPRRCLDREEAVRLVQERLKPWGCDIGNVDGKLNDKTIRIIARLRHFEPTGGERELTQAGFPGIERKLAGMSQVDGRRLCAYFATEDGLTQIQRKAIEPRISEVQDQPYAALSVAAATNCSTTACEWASVVGQLDVKTARRKALEACHAKAKSCVPAAAHKPRD